VCSAVLVALLLAGWLSGCSGGAGAAYTAPPAPLPSAFTENTTPNYFTLYSGIGNLPADARDQYTNAQYPLPISYELDVTNPTGFNLVADTESAIQCWAQADPRVCAISGVDASQACMHIILCDIISAQASDASVAIGLTTIDETATPSFTVQIATGYDSISGDPSSYLAVTPAQMEKTLCHELGHTLGLGHSPNPPDLMYFMENNLQGTTFSNFLTYADASTLWTTLNARGINWVPSRPAVTQAQPQIVNTGARRTAPIGKIVDIYRP
jgi:hypothetical protein